MLHAIAPLRKGSSGRHRNDPGHHGNARSQRNGVGQTTTVLSRLQSGWLPASRPLLPLALAISPVRWGARLAGKPNAEATLAGFSQRYCGERHHR